MKLDRLPEIIEFYGGIFDLSLGSLEPIEELDLLTKPSKPIPDKTTELTGLVDNDFKEAKTFADHAEQIFSFVERAPVIIAHNLAYDKELLEVEAQRLGRRLTWPRGICTVEATVHLKGFRFSLSNLHEHLFNQHFAGSHRARADVMALARCCIELYKRGDL